MEVPRAKIGDIGFAHRRCRPRDVGDLGAPAEAHRLRADAQPPHRKLSAALRPGSSVTSSRCTMSCPTALPAVLSGPCRGQTGDGQTSCGAWGIDVLEFWNHGAEVAGLEQPDEPDASCAAYLRATRARSAHSPGPYGPAHRLRGRAGRPVAREGTVRIELIDSADRFAELRAEWSELLSASSRRIAVSDMGMAERMVDASGRREASRDCRRARRWTADRDRALLRIARAAAVPRGATS